MFRPPEQQPVWSVFGECHTESEIQSRDLCRGGYRIMYKGLEGCWVWEFEETRGFGGGEPVVSPLDTFPLGTLIRTAMYM